MTHATTPTRTKIAAIVATAAAMAIFSASGAMAADDDVDIVFDHDGFESNYYECFMDGGTISKTSTTKSCTVNGKTTTCENDPIDEDAACSTEATARVLRGQLLQTGLTGASIIAPSNRTAPAKSRPVTQARPKVAGQ